MTVPDGRRGLRRLALSQHGVISREDVADAGLSSRAIERMVASGELTRILPGVYALEGSRPSYMRRVVAAYKWAGPGAVMSHTTSACLLRLDGLNERLIEVSTPRRLRSKKVVVHQRDTSDIPYLTLEGVSVARVEPTLLDLAVRLTPEAFELAFDSALRMGLTRYDRVKRYHETAAGRGVRGSAQLGVLLRLREPCPRPHHSILEVDFRQLIRRERLPEARSQFPVQLQTGLLVHLDFAYPSETLAIEIDSVRWHSGVRAIKWDNERQNLLVALGWRVLRFEWNDVVHRPQIVASQIRAALAQQQLRFGL
jgi:very-short-patch-repair endonuclease